jgi:hypothetical protein
MNDENRNSQTESNKLSLLFDIDKELKETNKTLMRINARNNEIVERIEDLTVSVRWISLWLLVSIILFASFYFWEEEILTFLSYIANILSGDVS